MYKERLESTQFFMLSDLFPYLLPYIYIYIYNRPKVLDHIDFCIYIYIYIYI